MYVESLTPGSHSPSQNRLKHTALALIDRFFISAPSTGPVGLLANSNIKIGLTELDTSYALTSFITLNDRGKILTTLEKLKAHWLQSAVTVKHTHLVQDIHNIFGNLYRLADLCVAIGLRKRLEDAEDLLVQLLYHWLDMNHPTHELWFGADKAYEWFQTQPFILVGTWLIAAQQLYDQLKYLCETYLDPNSSRAKSPSIHFPNTSTLFFDYHGLLLKLEIPNHLLALLLKFRQVTGNEWHERFPITLAVSNNALMQPICDLLHASRNIRNLPEALEAFIQEIQAVLPESCRPIDDSEWPRLDLEKSMLEAIERITVLAWKENANPRARFINTCTATIYTPGVNLADIISRWYTFCNVTDSYDRRYIDGLCTREAPASQNFLLQEWERELVEKSGLPTDGLNDIELEHILPEAWRVTIQNSGHTFSSWGFPHVQVFQSKMLQRIGNKALLWPKCNASCGNLHPDQKANHYTGINCSHRPSANQIKQIEKLGNELTKLNTQTPAPNIFYKVYFELRCAEIAAFALKRFCL